MRTPWTEFSVSWHATQKDPTDKMGIFASLIKKEMLHIVRDTRTMVIAIVMPLVLLLLFGFAISTEVNNVRIVAVVEQHNDETSAILERFNSNSYFTFEGLTDAASVEGLMRRGETDAALVLRVSGGKVCPQIIVDASNTVVAQASAMYIRGVLAGTSAPTPVIVRTLYNPQLRSAYNFVPGIMGMIFILICAIMASVSIVSEKETGTMNLLLVSPVRPRTIIFGKLVPYFLLSCVILAVMLTMAYTVLELPVSQSIFTVVAISLLYVVLSLAIGLLVSTLVNSQVAALIVSAVVFMIPVIMLSGMIFPIDNMPRPMQVVSGIIPARWYISAMRKLMIQQLEVSYVIGEFAILTGMTAALLAIAIGKFRSNT